MRVTIQRVTEARVEVEGKISGEIGKGLLVLAGFEEADEIEDLEWIANKMLLLRIFNDEEGKMNRSLLDEEGEVLIVSQFTLHASYKKGNRPSYINAAKPNRAEGLYESFINVVQQLMDKPVQTGVFGAHMKVSLVNDGPVTINMDSKNKE